MIMCVRMIRNAKMKQIGEWLHSWIEYRKRRRPVGTLVGEKCDQHETETRPWDKKGIRPSNEAENWQQQLADELHQLRSARVIAK